MDATGREEGEKDNTKLEKDREGTSGREGANGIKGGGGGGKVETG